jgi:pyruvate/2-oxoglutarate dehydrogenase complex dihydrolipoamide dehydrogenase (E3) component
MGTTPLKFVSTFFYTGYNNNNSFSFSDKSSFRALYFSMVEEEHKEPTMYKLICAGPEERVVGVHIIGAGSDEVMQGFAVAVKMGGMYF